MMVARTPLVPRDSASPAAIRRMRIKRHTAVLESVITNALAAHDDIRAILPIPNTSSIAITFADGDRFTVSIDILRAV